MKLYVAGRFMNYQHVRSVIDKLKEHGHEITHDWTRTKEFDENGELRPVKLSSAQNREYAMWDLEGVKSSEGVVLCCSEDMCGAYIEVGAAIASGKWVFVVGVTRWTVFYFLENVMVFPDYDKLYATLEGM